MVGDTEPVGMLLFFITKVTYFVFPAATVYEPSQFKVTGLRVMATSSCKAKTPKSVFSLSTIQTLYPAVTAGSVVASELVTSGIANRMAGVV